jgi:uncharacterized delta-60 repeat protein
MKRLLFLLTGLLLSTSFIQAQNPGDLDLTFNSDGINYGEGAGGLVNSIAHQPDGKILIGGNFSSYNGTSRNRIARLNSDGSIDFSFDPGIGANGEILILILLPGGKILIGGNFSNYYGISRNRIARLNSDGSLDASFNPGTGANAGVFSIGLQSDGKILIGGAFTSYNGTGRNRIARLNSDGSLDSSFNLGTGANFAVLTIVLQSDGKVLLGGSFTAYNGISRNRIARINSDGTLDYSFDPGSGSNSTVRTIVLQYDGKILIGGEFFIFNGTSRNRIARLNTDGILDTSFNPGKGANNVVRSLVQQSDGKILVSGFFSSYNDIGRIGIARLEADGGLDNSFFTDTESGSIITMTLQLDGKILIGGMFSTYNRLSNVTFDRLNLEGGFDSSFNPRTGANGDPLSIILQPDGKILIGGYFTSYNGITRNRIARLNSDGSLDSSFTPGTGANFVVESMVLQPDGKILIGGQFTIYNGTTRYLIARLNEDGSLDTSFNPGTGQVGRIRTMVLQFDGKILVGGYFSSFNGTNRNGIARLNSDGSLDTSFDPGIGTDNTVSSIVLNSNGKILIGGFFSSYNGVKTNGIARLNGDGSLDSSFQSDSWANSGIFCMVQQPDKKILIGGVFSSFNGTDRNGIARLNEDGSLDNSFNLNIEQNNFVYNLVLLPDGKILIGGAFFSYNGTSRNGIARINVDGSLDFSFNPGSGANGQINAIALQSDGMILIAGSFNGYNEVSRVGIARILNSFDSNDPCKTNSSPEINSITGPKEPISLGSEALVEVGFSDENISIITWKVFDGNTVIQEYTDEITGDKASRIFQNLPTGVYSILVELEDQCGAKSNGQYDYVVVYEPDGGFVTGGGWIESPEGAFILDPSLSGRANFGFVAKYKKGKSDAHQVDGNTEFQFRAADLTFKSSSHDDMSLVIANHKAIYKGKGSMNGESGYAFMVSVIDGEKLSKTESDKFRIKIWTESSGQVIYDNQMDAAENADPSTSIGSGSIVIHQPSKGSQNKRMESEVGEKDQINETLFNQIINEEFDSENLAIYPNPAKENTNVRVGINGLSEVGISIFDTSGRLIFSEEIQQTNSFTRSIPLEGISPGLYHVIVKINHQYFQRRLIKH